MKKIVKTALSCLLLFSFQVQALTFQDITRQIDETYGVRAAQLAVERAAREVRYLTAPEDYNFSLNPSAKASSLEDGPFGEEIEISGSLSLKIPLGLSSLEREKLNFALNALETARASLQTARQKAFLNLYSLYQEAWLLQQEEPVLALELEAAEANSEILQQRFVAGDISLTILAAADETLREKNDNYSLNLLKQRLAWYELMFNADLELEREFLEKTELSMEELPKPPEMHTWIAENHPLVIAEQKKLEQLEETISRIKKPDMDVNLKAFLNYRDHSASLNYAFSDPEITTAWDFPVYTLGSLSAGSSTPSWNTGVTLNFSLGTNKTDSLYADTLETDRKTGEVRLEYLVESLNLAMRSSQQQLIRSRSAWETAQNSMIRISENHKIMEAKKELGKVSEFELLESRALVERAKWKIEAARIDTEKSWLGAIETAAWYENMENPPAAFIK